MSWMYPDAKDTSNNMGKQLDAYFDKTTGKWVFPGEVHFIDTYIYSILII